MYGYILTSLFLFRLCYSPPKTSSYSVNKNVLIRFVIKRSKVALAKGRQLGIVVQKCCVLVAEDVNYPDIDWDNLSLNSNYKIGLDAFDKPILLQLFRTPSDLKGKIIDIVAMSSSILLEMFAQEDPFSNHYPIDIAIFVNNVQSTCKLSTAAYSKSSFE